MKFNHKLMRRERRRQNISQVELARRIMKAQSYISMIESGERKPIAKNCRAIESALGLAPGKLYKGGL